MSTFLRHLRFLLLALSLSIFAAEKNADLSRMVVIGDSLAAGYTNSSLHEAQQPHGFASLIATQAGVSLTLPLIAAPGFPNVLQLVSPGPPPIIQPAPGISAGRTSLDQPTNLAVPGHSVQDALTTRPTHRIRQSPAMPLGVARRRTTECSRGTPSPRFGAWTIHWRDPIFPSTP